MKHKARLARLERLLTPRERRPVPRRKCWLPDPSRFPHECEDVHPGLPASHYLGAAAKLREAGVHDGADALEELARSLIDEHFDGR